MLKASSAGDAGDHLAGRAEERPNAEREGGIRKERERERERERLGMKEGGREGRLRERDKQIREASKAAT